LTPAAPSDSLTPVAPVQALTERTGVPAADCRSLSRSPKESSMKRDELNRRDFNRLTTAALGGLVAGSVIGCGGEPAAPPPVATKPAETEEPPKGEGEAATSPMLEGKHVCRGLNLCKNQ